MPSEPSSRVSGVTFAFSARDERVEQRRRDPGPAGAELVGARNHARPDLLGAERAAGADGVAAEQVPLEALAIGVADHAVAERADAGGGAVQGLASLEQRRDRSAGVFVARACLGCELDRAAVAGDGRHSLWRERRAIENDRRHG